MNFAKFFIIAALTMIVLGLLAGSACVADDPNPVVSVDVDASAQLAIEGEAPVLPDDFAKNDPPKISANWLAVEQPAPEAPSSPAVESDSGITLFTSDGTWKCQPCVNQQQSLAAFPPAFKFKTVKIPKEGQSPTGTAPVWQGADGSLHEGSMDRITLEAWAKAHSRNVETVAKEAKELKLVSVVEIESRSSSAVMAALVQHIGRQGITKTASDSTTVQSWLPQIDVDVSDPLLAVLDSMMSKDGYKLGGLKVSWPAGKRATIFDPPIDVSYRKILEVSSKVKSVEINGREVVIRLDGRLINDLRVKLK